MFFCAESRVDVGIGSFNCVTLRLRMEVAPQFNPVHLHESCGRCAVVTTV